MIQDLRFAVRSLRRAPGFSAAAIAILALGIGVNTAIFSVVDGVVLRPLPYPEPDRLTSLGFALPGEYLVLHERTRSFESVALVREAAFNLSADDEPERVRGAVASATLFPTLGAEPLRGRGFLAADEAPGAERVVVIGHALWRSAFGGGENVLGRTILVDSEPHTIVGVMPAGFDFPAAGTAIWLPERLDAADVVALWGGGGGQVVARLAPWSDPRRAQAEVRALASEIRSANTLWTPPPEFGTMREVVPLRDRMVGDVRTPMLLVLAAVGLVLLIACVNVANLSLVRAAGRTREVAVCAALGASRARLVQRHLAESSLLALLGGGAGLILGVWGVQLLVGVVPDGTPRLGEVGMHDRVVAFSFALSMAAGLAFGLVTGMRVARPEIQQVLKQAAGRSSGGREHRRLTGALVVAQIALAAVLAIGATLLVRSFHELRRVDPGFSTERIVTARLTPPESRYGTASAQRAYYDAVLARVAALPGVERVAAVNRLPLVGGFAGFAFEVEGSPYVAGTAAPVAGDLRMTSNLIETLGIPLLAGRLLMETDRQGTPRVALINETMAREQWPGEDPVGKRFKEVWLNEWTTVVGVVGDVRRYGLSAAPEPEVYRPFAQMPAGEMSLVVRTAGDPAAVLASLRAAVAAVDVEVPVSELRALDDIVAASIAEPRLTMKLLASFAALALLLGTIGIYGVVSYAVAQRTREIGVRVALGARGDDVRRLVITQGVGLAAAGLAIGLVAAVLAARMMRGLLYGVSATDPLTFAIVPLVLLVTALLASWLPARRATRVDPLVALRTD